MWLVSLIIWSWSCLYSEVRGKGHFGCCCSSSHFKWHANLYAGQISHDGTILLVFLNTYFLLHTKQHYSKTLRWFICDLHRIADLSQCWRRVLFFFFSLQPKIQGEFVNDILDCGFCYYNTNFGVTITTSLAILNLTSRLMYGNLSICPGPQILLILKLFNFCKQKFAFWRGST